MVDQKANLPAIEETIIEESRDERAKWELQLQELRLREKTDFLSFRKEWSRNLLYLVVFIVVFTALFLIAVGLGWLSFMDEWLVRIIIAGSFVEVLGLAKIVVDFLFKEPPEK
ncbi:MAG: hypothetical protein ACEQSA_01835 [Weeksellaceae bacterium]